MAFLLRLGTAALVLGLLPSCVEAGAVTGVVRTLTHNGARAAAAVVYLERLDGRAPARAVRASLTQQGKAFLPAVLAVPVGSTVDFPNRDPIFHNVFSLSAAGPFDLGLYRSGASRSRTFTAPAAYRVFCNIHPQMSALIVVAPTPYVTVAGPSGEWRLDAPPGRYRLVAVSDRAAAVSIEVDVKPGVTIPTLTLDESTFIPSDHPNKFGQPYSRDSYGTR